MSLGPARSVREEGSDHLDRVDLGDRLVVAVAHHAREPQGHAARVARRPLHAVEGDLDDLLDEISESALFRLGRAISSCLVLLTQVLEDGKEAGTFAVEDPVLLANTLYASGLGALQLARVGILVKEAAPGIPTLGQISPDQVRDYLVASALALAAR